MRGLGPVAIALIGGVAFLSFVAIFFNTTIGKTVFFSIVAKETEVIRAVNRIEVVKTGLPYALEYSFYQAMYDVSKKGGYYSVPSDIPTYNNLPVWRKYDKTYEPDYILNTKQIALSNLNKYVKQVNVVNIPQYTGMDIVCGGGIIYQYSFRLPEVCYYCTGFGCLFGGGSRIGDITWSEGREQCVWANPDCSGFIFSGVRSDTIQYNVGSCSDEYHFLGDRRDDEVSAVEVANRAYIWASGEPSRDNSWALECCFPGSGTNGCNSDSVSGQRFHANNVFSIANKDQIDQNGASKEDVVKKFNSAWCGHKDRNCLLCHIDINDARKTKWYVCEGSSVPEGYGVVVVKAGEKIGSFECGYDGQWIQPTNIFCTVSTLTLKASSNGLISTGSNFYTAYDNPNTSRVVQSNLFNMFRIARERFIDKDTLKNTIDSVVSTNKFTCKSDNSTVKSKVTSSITSRFTEGDVSVEMRPANVIIKPGCNSTVAAIVEVKLTDKFKHPVYDGTTAYRSSRLHFFVITSNDYSFQPELIFK